MNRGLEIGIVTAAIALAMVACSREERAPAERARPPEPTGEARPAYRVIDVEAPGSLSGVVRWEGPRPELAPLPVRVHEEVCGSSQPDLALRVSRRGGVADAVVSLVDVEAGVALEPRAATVLTEECRYVPRVSAVAVGSPIVFRNADGVMHNVHARRDGETVWDFALPDLGSTEQRVLGAAGALRIVCDVHAWMEAWVHAFPHPYFAVSDAEGRFRITDVPPGQYVVRVWHESWRALGTRSGRPERPSAVVLSRTVSVSGRQETTVDFELGEQAAALAGE